MAEKCVRQGCNKHFTDAQEECRYHTGAPLFHDGLQGWECCKPRVLNLTEFMKIEGCTVGVHSTTDKGRIVPEKPKQDDAALAKKMEELNAGPRRTPIPAGQPVAPLPPPEPETEDDDESLDIADGTACRRLKCDAKYKKGASRDGEECVYHPGLAFFHDGAKGYTCCKRREFTFEQFKAITGCETKSRHLFIGSGKKLKAAEAAAAEGRVQTVRHDYYQTPTSIIASFFLKKIDEAKSKIEFKESAVLLDLVTKDSPPKRYTTEVPLYSTIDAEKSTYKVYGTKVELNLVKTEVSAWAVMRADERPTGDIPQVGKAVHM